METLSRPYIRFRTFPLFLLLLSGMYLPAQNYQALNGSDFAGSLGVHNNPASILQTPYRWDLTLFGVQGKTSTNFYEVRKYSLLSPPAQSEYYFRKGEFARYLKASANLNLFNARIAINKSNAIAFGVNVKEHLNASTSRYFFVDTFKNVRQYLNPNLNNQPLGMKLLNSGWVEAYASYARTVYDDARYRVNAGITVKVGKGLAGAYGSLTNGRFSPISGSNPQRILITNANLYYGYSLNLDQWNKNNSFRNNLTNLVNFGRGGAAFDLGAEWIIKPQAVSTFDASDDYYDYDWKIGLSLLDAGANQYSFGRESRVNNGVAPNVTDLTLNNKFDSTTKNLRSFNDSLATIAGQYSNLSGIFYIANPTRLVLNVDHYIQGNFYINAELSLNVASVVKKKWYYLKEMNVLAVTPRWENRKLGAYLPLTVNNSGQFWIGAAVKAGPLLFGLHNLGYIFSQKSIQNGGFYLALIIKPFEDSESRGDKRNDCPPGNSR